MRTYYRLLAVTLPPIAVAVAASTHPARLTVEDAEHWQHMHTVLIPVLPLLALGPIVVAWQVHRTAGLLVAVPAYTFATFYTALDVLAGVGGGAIKAGGSSGLGDIFPLAQDFELIGGVAYVIAAAGGSAVAVAGLARTSVTRAVLAVVPSVAVITGGVMLWQEHLYRPWGSIAQLLIAAGWGVLVVAQAWRPSPR